MLRSLAALAALVLAGCATTSPGPVSSPEFAALVAAALTPEEAASVRVMGPGTWTANSRQILEFANTGDLLFPSPMPWKDGVTVITARGLAFAEWDQRLRAYVVTRRIAREDVAQAVIDANGRSCALVVQEARDSSFHTFEFVRAGGMLNDCASARAAAAALAN